MIANRSLISKLTQLVAIELPEGVNVTVEWTDAPPDLLLFLSQQDNSVLSDDGRVVRATWTCDNMKVRARCASSKPSAKLKLVK
jgi:hypothetical protein